MFIFGFEETKFAHHETLEGRQGSIVSESEAAPHGSPDSKDEKHASVPKIHPEVETPSEEERIRRLSTININPAIPRKPYIKRLSLFTTSPGPWSHFLRHSWQPFMILGSIPGVLFCSLCYAVLLAWSTVMTTALSTYMIVDPYNFSASQIGLMSLAPFVGSTIGSIICGPVSDRVALWLSKRNNGIYEPEMRFWVFIPFIPFQVAGAFWFGYALDRMSTRDIPPLLILTNFCSAFQRESPGTKSRLHLDCATSAPRPFKVSRSHT